MKFIGKVFSLVTHTMVLGLKAVFLGITDGKSQMLLDFSVVGEEGKKTTSRTSGSGSTRCKTSPPKSP
jgi:hypothetical protein